MKGLIAFLLSCPLTAMASCDFPEGDSRWELDFEDFISKLSSGNVEEGAKIREAFSESFDQTGLPQWEFSNGQARFTAYGSTTELVYRVVGDCMVSFAHRERGRIREEVREFSTEDGRLCFSLDVEQGQVEIKECFVRI